MTWDAAVTAEEQAPEELTKNTLRLRIKCPKTGDEDREAAAQEAVSPSGDSGVIADQSTGGADGELAGDEHANAESASDVKEAVDEGCGSFKRKHANRRAVVPTCPALYSCLPCVILKVVAASNASMQTGEPKPCVILMPSMRYTVGSLNQSNIYYRYT